VQKRKGHPGGQPLPRLSSWRSGAFLQLLAGEKVGSGGSADGTQVNLGIRVRAKAVALNPKGHTAAVLTMGTSPSNGNGAVEIFDTKTGAVLQNYS